MNLETLQDEWNQWQTEVERGFATQPGTPEYAEHLRKWARTLAEHIDNVIDATPLQAWAAQTFAYCTIWGWEWDPDFLYTYNKRDESERVDR
jgi:hypothetical protein